MLSLNIREIQTRINILVKRRKELMTRRKQYIDYRDLALRRHTQFTFAQRIMIKTNLGFGWGLKYLSNNQNKLLDTRIGFINSIKTWVHDYANVALNKKRIVQNWEAWVDVQSTLEKLQGWVHTHERIVFNCRLKLMKNQEVLEKIVRDIAVNELEIRNLVNLILEIENYNHKKKIFRN